MSAILGIELTPAKVRAVVLQRWRSAPRLVIELPWDPTRPADAVAQLRKQIGPARRIALSIGLGFLYLKQVKLPPAPGTERQRMLALEPDRFFPVQDTPLVVALAGGENFACAVGAEPLNRWITAFQEWAPVECIEPAPVSFARAITPTGLSGYFSLEAGPEEIGLVELSSGMLRGARRIPLVAGESIAPSTLREQRVAPEFLCALGAALESSGPLETMLLPDPVARQIHRRRLERLAATVAIAIGSVAFAVWAMDRSREQLLARVRAEVAVMEPAAEQGLALRAQLAAIEQEAAAGGALVRERPDPLMVLSALSERLPAGATVLNLRVNADEWQIDGSARDAAALIPLLDRDERFEEVRFLSASSRYREDDLTYETFSIAFRVRPKT